MNKELADAVARRDALLAVRRMHVGVWLEVVAVIYMCFESHPNVDAGSWYTP